MSLRTPVDVGAAIRDRRRRLNLGQDDLAQRVGVSRKWIIDVEKGKPGAEIGLILRTLDALGLRLRIDTNAEKQAGSAPTVDIDRILDRAREKRS